MVTSLFYERVNTLQLRPYQLNVNNEIDEAYNAGHRNVLLVLPCGGGKTCVFSHRVSTTPGAQAVIAHRQELVGQMSLTLAKYGIMHRIIGPPNVVRFCISQHIQELGRDYYNPKAPVAAVGVDTLISWSKPESPHYSSLMRWAQQVTQWICDESHHLTRDNKWGKAVALFPNARGLGVTGTPERTDGKGLGRHADGLIDHMIIGPTARDLINGLPDWDGSTKNFLTEYRIICPPSDLDVSGVKIGADGDLVRKQLALATKRSTIMGDVVKHYMQWANGKLGITFAPDVETATMFMKSFNEAGVKAEVVTATTPAKLRVDLIRKFRNREILQLVNVDLFGEGFDLPAIEVVSMARRTESYGLYVQQFMRGCRIMEGKDRAIIIDHCGNVLRHGLPDKPREWTLDRRDRKASSKNDEGVIPQRACLNPVCLQPFERVLPACPYCGWVPVPQDRSGPDLVDGDLHELDPEVLAQLRGEVKKVNEHPNRVLQFMQAAGHPYPVAKGAANRHGERLQAQNQLRDLMSLWCGYHKSHGRGIPETQRRFYYRFGIDVMSAQCLGRSEAEALMLRVGEDTMRLIGGATGV